MPITSADNTEKKRATRAAKTDRVGIVQPEDFRETLYHLLIPKGVTREPEWDFLERHLVLGQEVVNLN